MKSIVTVKSALFIQRVCNHKQRMFAAAEIRGVKCQSSNGDTVIPISMYNTAKGQ